MPARSTRRGASCPRPPPAQAAKYAELKAAWLAAPDNAAAWKAYDTFAQSIANWFGVKNISAALFSLPLGFLIIWAVSLMTPGPSAEMRSFIDEIRRPRGRALFQEKTR